MRIADTVLILGVLGAVRGEEVRLLDLEPNDAQNLIEQQDQTLKYAPKIDSNVPAVRFLGQDPYNVLEDIYLAKQYHGQDGLGGYLYGYQVPDIAKNEQKKPDGNLKGAYNYVNGAGQEIRVEYWDDGTGFHQVDNIPDILPKPVEDLPEVKAAKEAFHKRWQEEAERNQRPVQDPYDSQGRYATGPLSAQGQKERAATFVTYQTAASAPRSASLEPAQPPNSPELERKNVPDDGDETSTGPPRGFFYAFDYPVGVITQVRGRAAPLKTA